MFNQSQRCANDEGPSVGYFTSSRTKKKRILILRKSGNFVVDIGVDISNNFHFSSFLKGLSLFNYFNMIFSPSETNN